MSDPATTSDRTRLRAVGQEYAALEPIVATVRDLRAAEQRLADALALVNGDDEELRDLAREDEGTAALDVDRLTAQLRTQLVPRDPLDDKNVILEIRGGEGGEEAALFAADLYRMYLRYAERHRWKVEELSASRSEKGGFKEVIFRIAGEVTGRAAWRRPGATGVRPDRQRALRRVRRPARGSMRRARA